MSSASTSITGYTTIPVSDRVARPDRRRVRPSLPTRVIALLRHPQLRRRVWDPELAAERAAAPAFMHPRDEFSLRHPGGEIQRF